MESSLRDQSTAVIRTLVQMLYGFLLAKLLALPGLEGLGLVVKSTELQVMIVGASTAFVMGLVEVLSRKVHAMFGRVFLIAKKPTYN